VVEVDVGDLGGAGGGLEAVAGLEVLGLDEGALGDVVEGVVKGCGDRCGGVSGGGGVGRLSLTYGAGGVEVERRCGELGVGGVCCEEDCG